MTGAAIMLTARDDSEGIQPRGRRERRAVLGAAAGFGNGSDRRTSAAGLSFAWGERQTLRWRELDSNLRFRARVVKLADQCRFAAA
jgi:hypothetical protein